MAHESLPIHPRRCPIHCDVAVWTGEPSFTIWDTDTR